MTSLITKRRLTKQDEKFWCNDLCPGTLAQEFEDTFIKIINDEIQDKSYSFIIEANELPVGFMQIFNVLRHPSHSGMIEVSILESQRARGYAKKAILILEDFCFRELGLMRLISPINTNNVASIALFSSLGYEKYFTDPSAFFFNKKPAAHEIWVKIKPE
jgi:RimJ/RimL family protein N-acetyltransferase